MVAKELNENAEKCIGFDINKEGVKYFIKK